MVIIPLNSPDLFYQSIIDIIESSESGDELIVNYFVIRWDTHGLSLIKSLLLASRRNVSITLIVDAYGSLLYGSKGTEYETAPMPRTLLSYLQNNGVNVYIYNDIESSKIISVKNLLNFKRFSRRDHNKNFVFHLKSQNKQGLIIGDSQWTDAHFDQRFRGNNVYIESIKIFNEVRSYHKVLIESKYVSRPQKISATDTDQEKYECLLVKDDVFNIPFKTRYHSWAWYRQEDMIFPDEAQFVHNDINFNNPYKRKTIQDFEISLIQRASEHVVYASPYFCPDNELIKEFQKVKHKRYVDFKIIMAKFRNDPFIPYGVRLAAPRLIKKGIHLYEYSGNGNLHYKDLIVDDMSFIKTANGDGRSRFYNLETGVIIKSAQYARINRENILKDIHNSKRLTTKTSYLRDVIPVRVTKALLTPFFYHHL